MATKPTLTPPPGEKPSKYGSDPAQFDTAMQATLDWLHDHWYDDQQAATDFVDDAVTAVANAAASAQTASTQATEAATSAASAASSATTAGAKATEASNSATAAAGSATTATTKATAAASSATTATTKATEAAASATAAASSATTASTKAAEAANSATAAASSATTASTKAADAANSATAAAGSATTASTKATEAASSASAAASSATTATTKATEAAASATAAASSATTASTKAAEAANSATAAASSALAAAGSATTAATKAAEAAASATGAANSATAAAGSATTASTKATEAAASAASAINSPGTSATSTTSLAVGTGSKTLTIQTGKAFALGQFVVIANTSAPANYMAGQITAHNNSTGALTVEVSSTGGTGTFAAWTVALTGPTTVGGPAGGVLAGNYPNPTFAVDMATQAELDAHTSATDAHPQYTTQAEAAAAAPVQSVAGKTGAVVLAKADVGLANVDNTSDANKPISTATQTALNAKQPLDADLTAIAALVGTTGLLKKTAADTWALDTSAYLTANQSIAVSGDASGTGTTAISLTLANSGVAAGTYNNVATEVRPFTVDAKGRVTSIGTAVTVTPAFSSITGKPTTLAGYGITDAAPSSHVGAAGTAHGAATTSVAGFMSATDKAKLDGIAASANNYSLPAATSTTLGGVELASDTVQSVAANAVTATAGRTYGVQANPSGQLVANVPWTDTVYTHPTGDGNSHVPATGTTNNGKVLKAGSTANSAAWGSVAYSEVTGTPTLGTAAAKDVPATGNASNAQVVMGSDTRLSDARTPTAHSHAVSDVTGLQTVLNAKQATLVSGTNIKTVNGESLLGAGNIDIVGAKPSLQGDPAPYITQTKTYQITNYNSFSTYSVAASAGTASISGDTITFTAPATAGGVSLTLTVDGQPTVFAITVQVAGMSTPTNVSPSNGATDIGASPTLQSSAFATYGATDTHLASRWRVYQGATLVHDSGWSTAAKTSYTVPTDVVAVSMTYSWTVEHRGTTLGDSPVSTATSFTTAATFNNYIPTPTATPSNFGDPLEGGFYAGLVWGQLTQSATSTTIGTGSKTFTVPSMVSAPIVYAGQTVEVRSRANPANKMVGTVADASGTILTLNITSVGGSGTFSDWSVMARFRIIVAPRASGENASVALKNANTASPTACQTLTEGFAATQAMRDADTSTVYPAAHWARALNIGGKTDWYIPARDELELLWRNLKPITNNNTTSGRDVTAISYQKDGSFGDIATTHGANNNCSPAGGAYTTTVPSQTTATSFRSGGTEAFLSRAYISSTEHGPTTMWIQAMDTLNPGGQFPTAKSSASGARAVRRSVI